MVFQVRENDEPECTFLKPNGNLSAITINHNGKNTKEPKPTIFAHISGLLTSEFEDSFKELGGPLTLTVSRYRVTPDDGPLNCSMAFCLSSPRLSRRFKVSFDRWYVVVLPDNLRAVSGNAVCLATQLLELEPVVMVNVQAGLRSPKQELHPSLGVGGLDGASSLDAPHPLAAGSDVAWP